MLLDTSGLLAYHSQRESEHEDARNFLNQASNKTTHSYVLAELIALATARKYLRPPILAFVKALLAHPRIEVVWVTQDLNAAALSLLEARPDKGHSLADAVSFVLMRERNVTEALSTDRHYDQEGFTRLLGP